jgi:hypothetical protein
MVDRVVLTSRVGVDGVLTLRVPLGVADANRMVRVIVEPVEVGTTAPPDREAWLKFIASTAGQWQGELERPEQGVYEQRNQWP